MENLTLLEKITKSKHRELSPNAIAFLTCISKKLNNEPEVTEKPVESKPPIFSNNKQSFTNNELSKIPFFKIIQECARTLCKDEHVYNFYPSDTNVPCAELCIGFAEDSFGAYRKNQNDLKIGFKGLMIDIIKCWFTCFDKNKETILFTINWNEKEFEKDWLPIIEAYTSRDKKVLVIQLTSNDCLVHYHK